MVNKSTIYKEEGTRKKKSKRVMLKVMTSEVIINLNMLSHFIKDGVVNYVNNTLVVIIYRNGIKKINVHISKCNQISLMVDVIS